MNKYKTVKGLLSKKERWTKGTLARFGNNQECNIEDPRAKCFCLLGAIDKVYNGVNRRNALTKLANTIKAIFGMSHCDINGNITSFNDDSKTTFKDIKKVLNKAKI